MKQASRTAITLHHLRIFSAVARESGFGRAAESLSLSQSTVSDQIRQLERILGFEIIDRAPGRRRSVLTAAGEVLLRTCDEIFVSLDRGFNMIEALNQSVAGSVAVATGNQFSGYVMPRLLEGFRREHPDVSLRVRVEPHWRILEDLHRENLDLAIVVGLVDESRIATHVLGEFDVVIVGPPAHRFATRTAVPFQELADEPLILPESTNTMRGVWERLAREYGVTLNVVLETSTVEATIRAVCGGVGLAALGLHCVDEQIQAGHLTRLDVVGFPVRFQWLLAYPRGTVTRPSQALREYLLRQAPIRWVVTRTGLERDQETRSLAGVASASPALGRDRIEAL